MFDYLIFDKFCLTNESTLKDEEFDKPGPSTKRFKQPNRGYINFITSKLATALDKCKLSDRDAVQILISTVEALGENVNKLIL